MCTLLSWMRMNKMEKIHWQAPPPPLCPPPHSCLLRCCIWLATTLSMWTHLQVAQSARLVGPSTVDHILFNIKTWQHPSLLLLVGGFLTFCISFWGWPCRTQPHDHRSIKCHLYGRVHKASTKAHSLYKPVSFSPSTNVNAFLIPIYSTPGSLCYFPPIVVFKL